MHSGFPTLRRSVSTFTNDPANPTLSFASPTGVAGPVATPDMISPTRDLPNARKDQWSFDVQRELTRSTALDLQYVGSNTSHLDRSFFNNPPAPGAGAVDPRRPTQQFRSRRIIQNDLIADYDAVSIILRQRGTRFIPGPGVGIGKDDTLFALVTGHVRFARRGRTKKEVSVQAS